MPRQMRNLGCTGWAHIILRGINRENLFYDEEDYARFQSTVLRFQKECGFELAIMCMMSNHVHLLLGDENGAYSGIIKRIAVSYANYYNAKYDRVGHVFQDRFRSEPLDDEQYFLTVLRYIYQNPLKAGIFSSGDYPHTHLFFDGVLSGYFRSDAELFAFLNEVNDDRCLEYDTSGSISEDDAIALVEKVTGSSHPQELQQLDRNIRNAVLHELKHKGLSVRQLSRLTGINRNIIQRA